MKNFIILAATGLVCGFVNGFLGTGGGIIIVTALTLLANKKADTKKIFASANLVILILSFVSAWAYFKGGVLDAEMLQSITPVFLLPALFGGLCGAIILDEIKPRLLQKIFYILICWCGARMLIF